MSKFDKVFLTILFGLVSFAVQAQTYSPIVYSGSTYGFNAPDFIAVDSNGNVWVSNNAGGNIYGNAPGSVTKMLASSNYSTAQIFNDSKYQFYSPQGIGFDSQGNVWVADVGGNFTGTYGGHGVGKVIKIPNGDPMNTPIIFNDPNFFFNGSQGLSVDSANNIWVTNSWGNSLTKMVASNNYSAAGAVVFSDPKYHFFFPFGIKNDNHNNVWISNYYTDIVTEIPNGDPSATPNIFGTLSVCAQFCNPFGLTIDISNNVWVGNTGQVTMIPHIGGNQIPTTPIVYSGGAYNSAGVAWDKITKSIWTVSEGPGTVTQIPINNPSQAIVYSSSAFQFNHPVGVAVDKFGNVWVTNLSGNSVTELKKN